MASRLVKLLETGEIFVRSTRFAFHTLLSILKFGIYQKHPTCNDGLYQRDSLIMAKDEPARYMWVRNQLVADIEFGRLQPNESLPSERALSARFDVSRMTARHALVQLEKEGLAYKNGRRSRYVAEPIVDYDLSKSISFFASAASSDTELAITVLGLETVVATDEQCDRLNLPAGSQIHFHSRLCQLGSRPAFVEKEFVSATRFPNLWDHDIAQPMSRLFEREYNVRSVRDQIVLKQCHLSTEISKILKVEKPAIGILLEQTVYDDEDTPISFGVQYWRGDVARFSADIRYS